MRVHARETIPDMDDGAWKIRANMTQGDRAVGGSLVVDSGRVSFRPHSLDRSTGGQLFDVPLVKVAAIDVVPRTFHPFDGGLRKRLRLRLDDGTEALFVVSGTVKIGQRIAATAQAAGGSPTIEL